MHPKNNKGTRWLRSPLAMARRHIAHVLHSIAVAGRRQVQGENKDNNYHGLAALTLIYVLSTPVFSNNKCGGAWGLYGCIGHPSPQNCPSSLSRYLCHGTENAAEQGSFLAPLLVGTHLGPPPGLGDKQLQQLNQPAPVCSAQCSDAKMRFETIPIREVGLSPFQLHKQDETTPSVTKCLQECIYKSNHLPAQPGCQRLGRAAGEKKDLETLQEY